MRENETGVEVALVALVVQSIIERNKLANQE